MATIPLEKLYSICAEANAYVKSFNVKGLTQRENLGISTKKAKQISTKFQELRNNKNKNKFELEHSNVSLFRHHLNLAKVHKLGNCFELSLLVIDFFLQNYPHIRAELFYIENGDHSFVIINRPYSSKVDDISTWGESTLICDPWANEIYPANEYKTRLKNFNQFFDKKNELIQYIENFDIKKHKLKKNGNIANDFFSLVFNVEYLKERYHTKSDEIITIIKQHHQKLDAIKLRLMTKYGESHPKVQALETKLNELEQIQFILTQTRDELYDKHSENYEEYLTECNSSLSCLLNKAYSAIDFTSPENNVLFNHENVDRLSTRFMKFFKQPSKSRVEITEALSATHTSLKSFLQNG